jgi:hypothetical protein
METDGDEGVKQGGVVSSFLAKINLEMASFQNEGRFGKKIGKGKGGERKQYVSRDGRDYGEVNEGRFSPKNKRTQLADEVEKEARWGRKGAGCSSPNKNKSPTVYSGPVLADVERTMQTARGSAAKMLEESISKEGKFLAEQTDEQKNGGIFSSDSMVIIGRKRELNGEVKSGGSGNDLKHSQFNIQFGSGMAEAAEQPRRPQ